MTAENIVINTQSSIRISGSSVIYFDPIEVSFTSNDADFVFITHEHYDHFSPNDIKKLMNSGTTIVAPASMKDDVIKKLPEAKNTVFLDPGAITDIRTELRPGLIVEPVRAFNVGKPFHMKSKKWLGYIVTMDDVRYYVAGDTDENEYNLRVSCDIALVPAGGTYTFNAKEAAAFVNKINPKIAIPTHYGSIVGSPDDGRTFKNAVKEGIEVVLKL